MVPGEVCPGRMAWVVLIGWNVSFQNSNGKTNPALNNGFAILSATVLKGTLTIWSDIYKNFISGFKISSEEFLPDIHSSPHHQFIFLSFIFIQILFIFVEMFAVQGSLQQFNSTSQQTESWLYKVLGDFFCGGSTYCQKSIYFFSLFCIFFVLWTEVWAVITYIPETKIKWMRVESRWKE